MSIWSRIAEALGRLARGEGLAKVFDRFRGSGPEGQPELSVAFTIAVIALGAKMAKADGRVTRDEVAAFREVFLIPPGEERNAARVFNLARRDIAGFEEYARRIARMFRDRPQVLCDVMEGLFHIALADGSYHPDEDAFLSRVAEIFGLDAARFARLRARFAGGGEGDPYAVLEVSPEAPLADIRRAWREIVRECHPDRMQARGLPAEAIELGRKRLMAANAAWEAIRAARGEEADRAGTAGGR